MYISERLTGRKRVVAAAWALMTPMNLEDFGSLVSMAAGSCKHLISPKAICIVCLLDMSSSSLSSSVSPDGPSAASV